MPNLFGLPFSNPVLILFKELSQEGLQMLFVKKPEETPLSIPPLDASAPAQAEQATFALG